MNAFSQDYSNITQGIDTITGSGLPGPIFPINSNVVPIVSGNLLSPDCGFSIFSVATTFGKGKVIAIGHEGMLSDGVIEKYDNQKFLVNSMKWLNSNKKRVLVKNGWLGDGNLKILKSNLLTEGYTMTSTNNKINSTDLMNVDIILFGNDWNNGLPYSESEVDVIKRFVENGGGVFITGLGWSFSNLEQYAMNSISKVFGFKYVNSAMWGTPFFTEFYPNIKNLTIPGSIKNLYQITKEYSSSLPSILQNNNQVREIFTKANIYLRYAVEFLPIDSELRDSIYNTYSEIISNYPSLFQKGKIYNTTSETAIIWNREIIQGNLQASKKITSQIINEIGISLGLRNEYLEIWEKNQVLLFDNSKLDSKQLKFAKDILNLIPKKLHNLGTISFSDYLGKTNTIALGNNKFGGVNTFSTPIGQFPENQFPNDVSPGITAIFCAAMAHEINHIVDAFYISSSEKFKTRKQQLINQAGTVGLNYLRNGNTTGSLDFFVNAPQEFFASIANQWFTNSEKVLELGLIRFDNDYKEPINQFLFYADVYSLGSDSTIFYKNDLNGNFSSLKVPIKRDGNGNIEGIQINNSTYDFQLDNSGNVLNYSVDKELNDTITYYVSSPEFEAISPKTIFDSKEIISTQKGDSAINRYSKFVYNPTYCSITDTLIIDVSLTGINQPNNTNTIRIYPNPAHSYVIVNTGNYQSMSDYSISIKNMLGQNVFNAKINKQEFRIDVNNFGGYGIYIVEITDNSNIVVTTRKIIIQ